MAGAGKKTFTAGEVLTAFDTNSYLMEQTVMNFGGTAARASAIPTPSTGMTSYIGTTGTATIPQIEVYTGSAWQTPYGLTQVASVSVTATTSVTIQNCFSAAYDNYRIVLSNMIASASGTLVLIQLRAGGTTTNTNYYRNGYVSPFAGITQSSEGPSGTWLVGKFHAASGNYSENNVFCPFKTVTSTYNSRSYNRTDGADWNFTGMLANEISHDSLVVSTSGGNITGDIKIYGYRNS